MLDAGEVRLRRIGEEVVAVRVGRRRGGARASRRSTRRSGASSGTYAVARALRAGELADAVDRVVVVERRQEPALRPERIRLADEPQRAGGVRREDAGVLALGRVEVAQHGGPRPLHERGRGRRRRVDGVRVAVDAVAQRSACAPRAATPRTGCRRCSRDRRRRGRRGARTRCARSSSRIAVCRRPDAQRGTRPPPCPAAPMRSGSDGRHHASAVRRQLALAVGADLERGVLGRPAASHQQGVDLAAQAQPEHRLHPHQRQAGEADRPRQRAADAAVGDHHHRERHPRPSVHANRLGFAETHSGGWRSVIARATTPIGLYRRPTVEPDEELDEEARP